MYVSDFDQKKKKEEEWERWGLWKQGRAREGGRWGRRAVEQM